MFDAKVMQYIAPNGQPRARTVSLKDECQGGYAKLTQQGCKLAAEVLTTSEVAVYIEHEDGNYKINVVPNGPQVVEALEMMVSEFDEEELARWKEFRQ